MLEQLTYKNHVGDVFEFGKSGIFVDTSTLHDYEWKASTKGNQISALTKQVQTRKLPVVIICETEDDGIDARNNLHEVAEKDVLAMEPGRIVIGDYYFKCYITGSKKSNYLTSKKMMKVDLTITSDHPYWVKETKTTFETTSATADGVAYPYDYPYNYAGASAGNEIDNTGFVESAFRMVIYGSTQNPSVTIGDHVYQVNCTVPEGSYLTIDSMNKTIYLTASDGTTTNQFANRNRDSYIFESIPSGTSSVTWAGTFAFDVILMEERSEPKWI